MRGDTFLPSGRNCISKAYFALTEATAADTWWGEAPERSKRIREGNGAPPVKMHHWTESLAEPGPALAISRGIQAVPASIACRRSIPVFIPWERLGARVSV